MASHVYLSCALLEFGDIWRRRIVKSIVLKSYIMQQFNLVGFLSISKLLINLLKSEFVIVVASCAPRVGLPFPLCCLFALGAESNREFQAILLCRVGGIRIFISYRVTKLQDSLWPSDLRMDTFRASGLRLRKKFYKECLLNDEEDVAIFIFKDKEFYISR